MAGKRGFLWRDPEVFVRRRLRLGDRDVDIAEFIAEKLVSRPGHWPVGEPLVYIVSGLPGSGKTTIGREAARLILAGRGDGEAWGALHVMLKGPGNIYLAREDMPPVITLDWHRMRGNIGSFAEALADFLWKIRPVISAGGADAFLKLARGFVDRFGLGHGGREDDVMERLLRIILYIASAYTHAPLTHVYAAIREVRERDFLTKILHELHVKAKALRRRSGGHVLVILDDVDTEGKLRFAEAFLRSLRRRSGVYYHVLIITTITESELLRTRNIFDYIEGIVSRIAGCGAGPNGFCTAMLGRALYKPIPPVTLAEFREIVAAELGHSPIYTDELLEKVLSRSGWHVSIALSTLRYMSMGGGEPGRHLYGAAGSVVGWGGMPPSPEEYPAVIVNRYLQSAALVDKMLNDPRDLHGIIYMGLVLQPMGISVDEIMVLCEKMYGGNRCSEGSIERAVEEISDRWVDIVEVYRELWPRRRMVLALRPGSYFHHLSMIVAELEKSVSEEGFRESLCRALGSSNGIECKMLAVELERFVGRISRRRAEILAAARRVYRDNIMQSRGLGGRRTF